MENNIQLFEHEEFGQIRTIEIDGEIYFVGIDVAKALGYKNPRDAVYKKVRNRHKRMIAIDRMQNGDGSKISTTIIDESGFYSLVLASKLKSAEEFQEWVTSEVLPTIRKTGSYNPNPQKLEEHTTIHTEKLTIKADSVTIQNVNITNYIEEKPKRSTSKNNRKGDIKLMDENQKDFLRSQLEDYLQRQGVDTSKRNGFACFCGSKDGCFFVPKTNHERWKCFSEKHSIYEKSSGDIFEYVKQQNNVDFKQSCEILSKMYHIPIGIDATPKKNYTNFYSQALKNQQKAIDYLKSREIIHANEIAQEFQIGYCNNYAYEFENNQPTKTTQAVIIPMSTESYSWRSITKNLKKKSGTIYPLNLKSLKDNAIKWFFLVEGEYDMFSIIDITKDIPNCEFSAICLSSANNLERFIDTHIFENIQKNVGLIIALDNDTEPNQNVEKSLQKGLQTAMLHKIPCIVADVKELYLNQKDSNEALKFNREEFKKSLIKEVEKAKNLDITQYQKDCDTLIDKVTLEELKKTVKRYEWNYIGQIDRCFDICSDTLRYCKQSKSWYQWDGTRLKQDLTSTFIDEIHKKLHLQCKKELELYKAIDKEKNTSQAEFFAKEHKTSINKKGLENALEGVSRRNPIAIKLLDLDNPKFLNCADITLNLETFTAHAHNIEDLCTKISPTKYNVGLNSECVQGWNTFLDEIMCHDKSMVEFLQRVCGYLLEISNREECFFILYGSTTRNGKSTLLETISKVLGDYSRAVSSATLSEKATGKEANPEVLALVGAKLITCGELNAETLLNDTLLKSISGRDTISARLMYDNNVQNFQINGKIIVNCNELPPMKNDDLLNSQRIIVIPFDRHFQEHEQNKDLKRVFSTSEYQTVILHWLIEGYKRYKQLGLKSNMPERVVKAIENYRSEANTINQFLNDNEVFDKIDLKDYSNAIKITNPILYEYYKQWCKKNGAYPHSSVNFKKQLKKNASYKKEAMSNGTRYYDILIGYKLRPSTTFIDKDKIVHEYY